MAKKQQFPYRETGRPQVVKAEQMSAEEEVAPEQAEDALALRRRQLEEERQALAEEKKRLEQEGAVLKKEGALLEKEKQRLEGVRKDLVERDRRITDREANAENGFISENDKTLSALKSQIAKLQGDVQKEKQAVLTVQREHDAAKLSKMAELDKWAEDYRRSKMEQADQEYASMIKEAAKQNELLKKAFEETVKLREQEFAGLRKEFDTRLKELQDSRQELLEGRTKLDERQAQLDNRQMELQIKQRMLGEQEEILNTLIDSKVDERVREMAQRVSDKERTEMQLIKKVRDLQQQLEAYETAELASGGQSKEALLDKISRLEETARYLKQELDIRPDKASLSELEEKARQYDALRHEADLIYKKNVELEQQKFRWRMAVSELEEQKELRAIEEKRLEVVQAQVKRYEEDVKKLKSHTEQIDARAERIKVIESPHFDKPTRLLDHRDETDWLENIYSNMKSSGLKFNKRLLYSFHTALKTADWSPLTILAGVSGTGKSELPKQYSRYGGLYFLPMSVQPDWDSPQSLFGYFNSVDNKYNATTLIQAMAQFQNVQKEGSTVGNLAGNMMLVLLDEMNLAHVELYFSELLSKLEMGRGNREGQHIEVDMGADHSKYKVQLSRNILWVGTMNEDETTKSLSDKVLDRGNMISFPRPTRFESRRELTEAPASPMLRRETWSRWLGGKVAFSSELDKYKERMEDINAYLEVAGRALGHRVWQAMENYVANHPVVIRAYAGGSEEEFGRCLESAFEEAIVHKVMPKLRGIDTTDGNSKSLCLDPIGDILADISPGLVEDYQLARNPNFGYFMWKSAKYLERDMGEV